MKVVHLATKLTGGAGIAAWRQHCALKSAGIESQVITLASPNVRDADVTVLPDIPRSVRSRIQKRVGLHWETEARWSDRLDHAQGEVSGELEAFSIPFSRFHLEEHPAVQNADILHLHWVSGLIDYPRFFTRIRKPLVWTLHDQNPYLGGLHYEMDLTDAPSLARLEQDCLQLKRQSFQHQRFTILGNSHWNTSLASSSGVFQEGSTFDTVYYPLDTDTYSPRNQNAARDTLGLPSDVFLIGFACDNLANWRKGFPDLIQSLTDLALPGKKVALVSFGKPPEIQTISRMPHTWFHFGFVADDRLKAAIYSSLNAFVAPSRMEAFGQTAIEAMACGTPVIATEVGGLKEATGDGDCGLLIPPGQPGEMQKALKRLMSEPALAAQLSQSGRPLVVKRHNPAGIGAQLLQIYQRLMS